MSVADLKAAKARHDFKARGGKARHCPPGEAETLGRSFAFGRYRSQHAGITRAAQRATAPDGIRIMAPWHWGLDDKRD